MKRIIGLTLTLPALLGLGCHSASRHIDPVSRPGAAPDEKVAHGQVVFMRNCHQCHPNGHGGLGPSLNDKCLSGFLIESQVRLGLGQMPGFTIQDLSRADLADVVAYLKALRKSSGG
jgi:mono/diheme cytochrome c family protein